MYFQVEKRSKKLAIKQFTMLCSAIDSLRPGGHLVYSTCSISPYENDENICKLLQKRVGIKVVDSLLRTENCQTPTPLGVRMLSITPKLLRKKMLNKIILE